MGLFKFLFDKKEAKKELAVKIRAEEINFFKEKAEEKIETERWVGRRKDIKVDNFVNCWITEEAFKKILIKHKAWFRHRGLYVGDAAGSVKDFEVKIRGEIKSIGIRSISDDSLNKWKTVAYPDDRFREEKENTQKSKSSGNSSKTGVIADFMVVCHNKEGLVRFLGMMDKRRLLEELSNSKRLYSRKNQEYFRVVGLEKFNFERMVSWIDEMERNE